MSSNTTINLQDRTIIIKTDSVPNIFTEICNIQGHRWSNNVAYLPINSKSVKLCKQLKDEQGYVAEAEIISLIESSADKEDNGFQFFRQPLPHQQEAFNLSKDRDVFALFMEQGTGKTKVAIDTAVHLYHKQEIDCLIIVAFPNGIHRQWIDDEIPKDISPDTYYKSGSWNSALTKTKIKELQNLLIFEGLSIVAFNVEAFISNKAQTWIESFLKQRNCILVLDQSACIKTAPFHSKRTKYMHYVSKMVKYKRILEGAPSSEGLHELLHQYKFLSPDIIGISSSTKFKNTYCSLGFFGEVKGYINTDKLFKKIDPYTYKVKAEDCLKLPVRDYKTWRFDLCREERMLYNSILLASDNTIISMSGRDLTQVTPVSLLRSMYLQRAAGGQAKQDKKYNYIVKIPSRIQALMSLLDILEGKTIIFSCFTFDSLFIKECLGDSAVEYRGGIKADELSKNKQRFISDDKIKYFIGQPKSAGIGHNLSVANNVIFYTNDYSLRFREECEKRAHRQGQTAKVMKIYDIIASHTIDKKITDTLTGKKDFNKLLMERGNEIFK